MPQDKSQAKSWAEVKVYMNSLDKAAQSMPAPPVPRDSWSEKVNGLNRTLEGMREQLASEVENEDLQADRAEEE